MNSVDINKFRQTSSFINNGINKVKTEREIILEQSIKDFDLYQKYMPNTHKIYLNYSDTPILGTMQDITDLELRTDTKYMLTSLENKVYQGDVLKWDEMMYLCIYDKVKTTANCFKVKIQPCNAILKFIFIDENNKPIIRKEPIITNVYFTDIRNEKIPIPWSSDLYGLSIQYNKYTQQFHKQSRVYLYESAWEIVGIDYTNINYQNNKGFYRYMIKPIDTIGEFDNKELKIADYYKYFPKNNDNSKPEEPKNPENPNEEIKLSCNKSKIKIHETVHVNCNAPIDKCEYIFEDNKHLNCKIINITDTGFDLVVGDKFGIIFIDVISKLDKKVYDSIMFKIGQ